MSSLEAELDAPAAETAFSGVVRVDGAEGVLARAYGLAHRAYAIPIEIDTQFAIASGAKGLTALTVVSLIESGVIELSTTARSLLGGDLPLIDDDVTVEHLLSHRSGIGDYLDEEADLDLSDYLMPVPVHELATTEDYLAALDGLPPQVQGRGAILLLQQRVRRPGADRGASKRRVVPRPGRSSRARTGRHGRYRLLPIRSASAACRGRVRHGRRRMAGQHLPSAGARRRRRWRLHNGRGCQVAVEGRLHGPDRVCGMGRRDHARAWRAAVASLRPWFLAAPVHWRDRASKAATPGSPSEASTIREEPPPTPSSRIRRRARGRSLASSTSASTQPSRRRDLHGRRGGRGQTQMRLPS
jgi:Beta-lactamase